MKIYNGEGMLLGRLATYIAKDALLGEEVKVVNCAQIMISGRKVTSFDHEKERRARKGYPTKSAKHIRLSDRFVRRAIRGMLPWKQTRGREAYKRVMCYTTIPAELEGQEMITIESASVQKLPTLKYITVGQLMKHLLGGNEE
ncbi:50S ribosomal protein L13 [Candidatus Woesearchaeota archaeon CG10_big_fil_rev_8_21_14_0_10_32_24]|nr:MAG: 50S ribosomal protein L13 [Candidatus Woesearchaeota archaeon CG10_big_fil_rev_8_21_14_0_10_32_24]